MNEMETVVSCDINSIKKNKIIYDIEISISNIKHMYKSGIMEVVDKFISKYRISGMQSSIGESTSVSGDNITYKFLSYHFGSWDADELCSILHKKIEVLDEICNKGTIKYTLKYHIASGVRTNVS